MTSIRDFVQGEIANNKIVVFSKSYCPYCKSTKAYINTSHPEETIHAVELDLRSDGDDIQNYLKELTGARSVPRTFINGQFVGGNDDLHNMPKDKLNELLALKRS